MGGVAADGGNLAVFDGEEGAAAAGAEPTDAGNRSRAHEYPSLGNIVSGCVRENVRVFVRYRQRNVSASPYLQL
jgi:hypothetical protein